LEEVMRAFTYPYRVPGPDRPAAAFVWLKVAAYPTGDWHPDIAALADTGADVTVLPDRVIETLGLVPSETETVSGFDGQPVERPLYSVRLIVRDLPEIRVNVLGGWDDEYAILGRDVLNLYRVVFDGPNLRLEISG
jgi:predicted aspartyl protease